jgi:3-oxoacyl-[acyl-carrier protein] reductase
MPNGIQGKTAIITGASRGIGAATARMLAREGVSRLILHYNSNAQGAEALTKECHALGAAVELIGSNLASEEGIAGFVLSVKQKAPGAQILINNAGHLVKRAKLAEFTSDLWDEVMNLNAKSVYLISQAVAPGMAAAGGGCIINLSSIAARNGGGPGATVYAASKAAVACITKGMAKELAPQGIRVNAVSPGTVDNDFHAKYSTRQMLDGVITQTPAGKLGTNEEISDCIQFLLSPGAAYIIGQTIEINGGMYMV